MNELSEQEQAHLDHLLTSAVDENNLNAAKRALKRGADVNSDDGYPIHTSIDNNNLDMLKLLIDHGADVCYEQVFNSPLITAISHHRDEMVDLLLENGADVKALDNRAVLKAVMNSDYETVQKLAAHGAEIDLYNNEIMKEAARHSLEALKLCESMGGDIRLENKGDGNNLLRDAACYGPIESMDYLINQGLDFNAKGEMGNDCLALASGTNDADSSGKVLYLLNKGANPNACVETLIEPIFRHNNHTAMLLLDRGADPTANNDNGLYAAIQSGNKEIMTYLLIDKKMNLNDDTRHWIKDGANEQDPARQDAQQILDKRALEERLQSRLHRTAPTKDKKQVLKL